MNFVFLRIWFLQHDFKIPIYTLFRPCSPQTSTLPDPLPNPSLTPGQCDTDSHRLPQKCGLRVPCSFRPCPLLTRSLQADLPLTRTPDGTLVKERRKFQTFFNGHRQEKCALQFSKSSPLCSRQGIYIPEEANVCFLLLNN